MKFMNKRGQAALEFLTSYGWAILVVLVMIGALSSFGILTPGTFLPERCNIDPSFQCIEFNAKKEESEINLILRNQLGLTIDSVSVSSVTAGGAVFETPNCEFGNNSLSPGDPGYFVSDTEDLVFGPGANIHIKCDTLNGGGWATVGSKENFQVVVEYSPQGRTLSRVVTADLYINVQ